MTLTSPTPAPSPRHQPAKSRQKPPKAQQPARKKSSLGGLDFGQPLDLTQWENLQSELAGGALTQPSVETCFGEAAAAGAIYHWGLACAAQGPVPELPQKLARLGCDAVVPENSTSAMEDRDFLTAEAEAFVNGVFSENMPIVEAAQAVLWAAAMPGLSRILPHEVWWQCGEQLLQLRADAALRSDATSGVHLLLAGELGLTLGWRLGVLPSCGKLTAPSIEAVASFLRGEDESIDRSLVHLNELRLIVASLVRSEKLLRVVDQRTGKKFKKRDREIAAEFATWMAALTRRDGTQVFSAANAEQCELDYAAAPTPKNTQQKPATRSRSGDGQPELHGLMQAASEFDPDTLAPALAAALGQSQSGGRLAWEISLPEAMWHSETSKCVALLSEWDVRRGRTYIDYSGEDVLIEIMGGRRSIFQGKHQTMITVNGVDQQPTSGWECTCEYSDDDVHLIEIEQQFSGGVMLQRQWLLVRDDRCLLVSDTVLPSRQPDSAAEPTPALDQTAEIQCISRLPLAEGVDVVEDSETRELVLTTGKKRRTLVMPLAASEWRVGPTACVSSISEDRHLVTTTRGNGAVYAPVWLDFQTRRFKRQRTWRQLTVAEDLTILPRHVAAAFRVQVGSEQWVVYRALLSHAPQSMTPRSVLGKHLIADFFAARFHPGDGGMEELVTVDAMSEHDPSKSE